MSERIMIDYDIFEEAQNNIKYAIDELIKRNDGGDLTLIIDSLNATYKRFRMIEMRRFRNVGLKNAYEQMKKAEKERNINAYNEAKKRYNYIKEQTEQYI